jgi:hypothetical protein
MDEKVIKILEREIETCNKIFKKAEEYENYSHMATEDAFRAGLEFALSIIKKEYI